LTYSRSYQDEKKRSVRLLTAAQSSGKSTLMAVVFDSKTDLMKISFSALQRDRGMGHAGEDIDYALLLRG